MILYHITYPIYIYINPTYFTEFSTSFANYIEWAPPCDVPIIQLQVPLHVRCHRSGTRLLSRYAHKQLPPAHPKFFKVGFSCRFPYLVAHPTRKWVITPVINGISRVNPLITGVITHLLSGMNHFHRGFQPHSLDGMDWTSNPMTDPWCWYIC